jgi:hypothetical protein
MRESELLEALEDLARKLNIRVRRESFRGDGGLCRLGEQQWIILNRARMPGEQVQTLAESLAVVDLDGVFVQPQVRDLIEIERRRRGDSEPQPV